MQPQVPRRYLCSCRAFARTLASGLALGIACAAPVLAAQATESKALPSRTGAPVPALTRVEPTAEGYVLIGRDFPTGRGEVQVFEGTTQVPAASVISVTSDRITVRSRPTGVVEHKVVAAGQSSNVVRHTHAGLAVAGSAAPDPSRGGSAKPPTTTPTKPDPAKSDTGRPPESKPAETAPVSQPAGSGGTGRQEAAAAPRRLSLGALSVTGHRADAAAAPRNLTLGSLTVTGHRADAATARSLTLQNLSVDGWRE